MAAFSFVDPSFGCVFLSSPQGHSGKTTVTIGICDSFRRKGYAVQPFKKGPDYIDPSWLTAATGRACRNLDPFIMGEEALVRSFRDACEEADVAVVEGAMGLYDGVDSDGSATSAALARMIGSPIILVVNSARMTGSIAAMVSGYQHFQRNVNIAGVILNYVSGPRHESKLRDAIERHCRIPVVGSIPKSEELHIEERHLGLVPSEESNETALLIERIGRNLEPHLDLDKILEIARTAKAPRSPDAPHPDPRPRGVRGKKPTIGVIGDRVFTFYYPENLEALQQAGAEIVFINSLRDRLPDIHGLYIGGGFPEFFLEELEENRGLRQDIARAIESDMPVYAECAGLMYLCRKIHWRGRSNEMVGILPADVEILDRPQGHGYILAEVADENPFFPVGTALRGHEFHHAKLSLLSTVRFAYRLRRGQGIDGRKDGIVYKKVLASFTHLHALGSPEWADAFVSVALRMKKAAVQPFDRGEQKGFPIHGN